jgi:hypothetical protein
MLRSLINSARGVLTTVDVPKKIAIFLDHKFVTMFMISILAFDLESIIVVLVTTDIVRITITISNKLIVIYAFVFSATVS